MDTTEDGAESSISPSPTTSISSLSWASSTSTETHTWQPLCLFRFLRPPPPTPPPQYHARVIRGTLARSSERFAKYRHENLDREPLPRRKSQPSSRIILAPVRENLGTSAPELNEVLRTIQEAWPRQRSRSSASRREPRRDQDLRHPRTSCGCREEEEGGGRQEDEEEEEDEEEGEEEPGGSTEEEGDMGSSCRSGKAAEEGEARTSAAGGGQPFLPHQLPRRRYSVPEVVIRKLRMAAEEQWTPQPSEPFPQVDPLSTRPLGADEWSRTKPWRRGEEESPRRVTYQNRGSQIGGRLTYFGEPGSERLEISQPPTPPASPPQQQVMSLIPRYSAIPRTDSMSVNLGGDGSGLVPTVAGGPPLPPPVVGLPVVSKGAESEDCSLVDSLEDEAVVMARRNQARAAKALSSAGAPTVESPARTPKPKTPLVGGEAFFVAIGSSSPATSISLSGSSPSPCSSEKHKQPPERVKKASMSVGPETVSAMPKRLRDRLAQRHRRLVQKMERQRNQRKKAEEMATAKKTIPRPSKLRNLSKTAASETQSKPSQPQRRVSLGHTNRTNIPQPGGRVTKPHGASGPTPSPKGGTPLRSRGGTFQQKFKCIPEDRSLHLGSSSSSTPPSSLSASSVSDEEEVEVDVISVEAGSETDAARLRPRLMSENAKKLGGRNRSRSGGSRHGGTKQSKPPHEVGISELQTIKEESKGSVETENEGKGSAGKTGQGTTDEKTVNKENEVQVTAAPLNDSNNNMHYSVDLQGKRVDLVSEPGDSNIVITVEQNGEAQLEGAAPQPALKSASDEDSRSSKSSTKSNSKRGSLKRQKTNESLNLLNDQVSHKGKVALGIENNNEDDLVSLSCGWLNFYLMHADLKSSFDEDDSKSSRKEERSAARESRRERELKPQKTITRIATHARHTKASNPDLSAPDPNGSGFPTKLPQIVSPENSPTQESVNLTSSATHPRSRLPRPLQASRVQNTQNSLVPINNPSSIVARPTQLTFLPNPNRTPSDSSHAPHSSSPTSPASSTQPNDRGRHRSHRRRRGKDVEWGTEASTGTQTGTDGSHGWSVTIAGSCPQPDVEMRLTFPAQNGRSRCSGDRGRQHQSDSGLGEENGVGRDRRGQAGGPTGQRQPQLLPSSVPLQEQHETWLLTLRNESTNPGGALEEGIGQANSRLKPLKCLPEISYQPPSQDAGTKSRANKVTVRANRASTLRLKSAHPGFVPAFLENNTTIPIAEKGDKSLSMFWPKVRRALEQKQLDHNNRDALRNEINAMEMILGTREKVPIYRMAHAGTKLEIHGSALNAADSSRVMEKVGVGGE